jgi:hypothetical protein
MRRKKKNICPHQILEPGRGAMQAEKKATTPNAFYPKGPAPLFKGGPEKYKLIYTPLH